VTARDVMLGNIRGALGTNSGVREQLARSGDRARTRGSAPLFAEALTALGGVVYEAANVEQARERVQEMIAGRSFVGSCAPLVRACGFETAFSREACAEAEIGISSADFALADTGSLVFLSGSRESRLISLLPPVHIAIIGVDQILGGLEDLFARVPLPAAESSSMVLITGPSRTGDIEMRLVRGVHGPGEIVVVTVKEVTSS
jgi:L-lactate dehydrogenase complex protein LldG